MRIFRPGFVFNRTAAPGVFESRTQVETISYLSQPTFGQIGSGGASNPILGEPLQPELSNPHLHHKLMLLE